MWILTDSIIIIIIMALQPFGPWPLFQFVDPIHSRQGSLDGGSARRKTDSIRLSLETGALLTS
jgi:hypothetical protein